MHFRRAILLFALVLGLTALATSIAPSPRGSSSTEPAVAPPPPLPPAAAGPATISFHAPAGKSPPRHPVAARQHVVVQVSSAQAGQATIPRLGQVGPVDPHTPARFDLLPSAGSFDVLFLPAGGGPAERLGTLVVEG